MTSRLTDKELGAVGERLVAHALEQRGLKILGRNVRTRYGEIDIIAKTRDPAECTVLFVEVKTRRSRAFGYPEEAITNTKRLHLYRASTALAPRYAPDCNYAILIVAVEIDLANRIAKLRQVELDG
ncbi:MAG: YraN family protein [bacterium]|nr:YraN family protein [bacterium]